MFEEPASITNVIDAFDDEDPFDLNLSLQYENTWKRATIRRETHDPASRLSDGGYVSSALNVAAYEQTVSRLRPQLELGLFHDVALTVNLPIILSNSQSLGSLDGTAGKLGVVQKGAPGEWAFALPFDSPTRSGLEYLGVGLDVGIFNQHRDPTKLNWVIGVEGRFNVSEPMHACTTNTKGVNLVGQSEVECAYPSDINRNGVDDGDLEGSFSGDRSPGVSRGTTGLEAHTYLSKRVKYVEPYVGLTFLAEFPTGSSDFSNSANDATIWNMPPMQGTLLAGLAVVPWEVREGAQRIEVDFQAAGTYVSPGRDYSEIFDALGSSDAPSLRNPNYAKFTSEGANASVVDLHSEKVYTTGLTQIEAHGEYRFSLEFGWQPARLVRFNVGGAVAVAQSHIVTYDQPCNPDLAGSPAAAGPCKGDHGVTGVPNPMYRAAVDSPGNRFVVDGSHWFDLWLSGALMF